VSQDSAERKRKTAFHRKPDGRIQLALWVNERFSCLKSEIMDQTALSR
jgi:hypothetical protein